MYYNEEIKAITLSQDELKKLTIGQAKSWHMMNSRLHNLNYGECFIRQPIYLNWQEFIEVNSN